jgi:hypothetical protein
MWASKRPFFRFLYKKTAALDYNLIIRSAAAIGNGIDFPSLLAFFCGNDAALQRWCRHGLYFGDLDPVLLYHPMRMEQLDE